MVNRNALKMQVLLLEQPFPYCDTRKLYGTCVWCGQAGGDGGFPFYLQKRDNPNWDTLDLHEWLLKRSSGLPKETIFVRENCVLLHHKCHMKYGQTKEMAKRCYRHKKRLHFYDIDEWISEVQNRINHKIIADYRGK